MAGRVLDYVTLGILLFAATFAVLAMTFSWAKVDDEPVRFAPMEYRAETGDAQIGVAYSSEAFDDFDGIGMARAGGVLFLVGTILVGLAALVAEHRLVLGQRWIAPASAVACLLAALVLATGLVLLPIGIAELARSDALGLGTADLGWRFGLYAGIVAAAGAIGATVTASITAFREVGFKLELADAGAADFDA